MAEGYHFREEAEPRNHFIDNTGRLLSVSESLESPPRALTDVAQITASSPRTHETQQSYTAGRSSRSGREFTIVRSTEEPSRYPVKASYTEPLPPGKPSLYEKSTPRTSSGIYHDSPTLPPPWSPSEIPNYPFRQPHKSINPLLSSNYDGSKGKSLHYDSKPGAESSSRPQEQAESSTDRLACSFSFLGCMHTAKDFATWDAHSQSHLNGHLPRVVRCPFKYCNWTAQAHTGVIAWRNRYEHVITEHQEGEIDTERRPPSSLIRHLLAHKLINREQLKTLLIFGRLENANPPIAVDQTPPSSPIGDNIKTEIEPDSNREPRENDAILSDSEITPLRHRTRTAANSSNIVESTAQEARNTHSEKQMSETILDLRSRVEKCSLRVISASLGPAQDRSSSTQVSNVPGIVTCAPRKNDKGASTTSGSSKSTQQKRCSSDKIVRRSTGSRRPHAGGDCSDEESEGESGTPPSGSKSPDKRLRQFPCFNQVAEPEAHKRHNYSYGYISQLLRHMGTHHSFYACSKCIVQFQTEQEYVNHVDLPHSRCKTRGCRRYRACRCEADIKDFKNFECDECISTPDGQWKALFLLKYPDHNGLITNERTPSIEVAPETNDVELYEASHEHEAMAEIDFDNFLIELEDPNLDLSDLSADLATSSTSHTSAATSESVSHNQPGQRVAPIATENEDSHSLGPAWSPEIRELICELTAKVAKLEDRLDRSQKNVSGCCHTCPLQPGHSTCVHEDLLGIAWPELIVLGSQKAVPNAPFYNLVRTFAPNVMQTPSIAAQPFDASENGFPRVMLSEAEMFDFQGATESMFPPGSHAVEVGHL